MILQKCFKDATFLSLFEAYSKLLDKQDAYLVAKDAEDYEKFRELSLDDAMSSILENFNEHLSTPYDNEIVETRERLGKLGGIISADPRDGRKTVERRGRQVQFAIDNYFVGEY